MDLRKIDALVAEKVMGWTQIIDAGYALVGHHASGGHAVPRYSSDIAAAWTVWEKLKADGPGGDDYFCCMDIRWPVAEGYEVVLRRGGHDEDHDKGKPFVLVSQVRTAPLAICLAALKAKGVEVEP